MTPDPTAAPIRPFDRALLARRRTRAAAAFGAHDFLVRRAADDIIARLKDVNRNFPLALDLGCHQGTITNKDLPPGKIGTLIHADLSPAMVAHAPGIRLAADEEALPFREASFHLIASALSLHWVNDLPGTLIQIRRALKPDGLFIAALLGGETLTELRQAVMAAEIECDGGLSPRISPFADLRDLGHLLQRAGFALPVADADKLTVTYTSPLDLMWELRGMGETSALADRHPTPLKRHTLMRAAEIYQQRFGLEGDRIPATFEIIYLAGWAPHESQQKPLRPGSAQTRLADALKTTEQPKR